MINATSITISTEEIGAIADVVGIIVVGILIWQFILLKKQISHTEKTTKLAHWPLIYPRIIFVPQVGPYLAFDNIGNGSAKEVHISLWDAETDKELPKFDVLALKPDETRNAKVDFLKHKKVKIKGTYLNAIGDKEKIDLIFAFGVRNID